MSRAEASTEAQSVMTRPQSAPTSSTAAQAASDTALSTTTPTSQSANDLNGSPMSATSTESSAYPSINAATDGHQHSRGAR